MYGDGPERIDWRVVERVARCPAAGGVGTKVPSAAVERWAMIRDACASWHAGTEPDEVVERQFGVLDPVHRRIVTDLFRTYVRVMGPSRHAAVISGRYSAYLSKVSAMRRQSTNVRRSISPDSSR